MKPFALLFAFAMIGGPAAAAPPEPVGEMVPSGPASAYAVARQACAKQGRKVEPFSAQTNDKYTQVAVTVSYRCGARLAKPARKR